MGGTVPYCGPPPVPNSLWSSWNLDPFLLTALAFALLIGLRFGESTRLFVAGWTVLVVAFVSPLCALTTALFSGRALHHIAIVSIAAPLLAYGLPIRRAPLMLAAVMVATGLVLWHVPVVYSAAWDSAAIYWLMQLLLLCPAWAFWSSVLRHDDHASVLLPAMMVGALAGTMGLIGAVLTFSPQILYPQHFGHTLAWGLSPIGDQQLAGLVMWVPGLLPLAVVAGIMAKRVWLQASAA